MFLFFYEGLNYKNYNYAGLIYSKIYKIYTSKNADVGVFNSLFSMRKGQSAILLTSVTASLSAPTTINQFTMMLTKFIFWLIFSTAFLLTGSQTQKLVLC